MQARLLAGEMQATVDWSRGMPAQPSSCEDGWGSDGWGSSWGSDDWGEDAANPKKRRRGERGGSKTQRLYCLFEIPQSLIYHFSAKR